MIDAENSSNPNVPELEALTDALPTALIVMDRQGGIVLANTLVSKLLGLPPDQSLVGMLMWQALPVGLRETVATMQREVLIYGSEVSRDFELIRPDGAKLIDIQMSQVPDKNGQPEYFSLSLSDATDRQQVTELKKIDRLKSNFMALVSHELRTPLTSIRGAVHLLAEKSTISSPPEKTLVDIIQSNSERLIRLVNNLLEMVAIDNDTFAVNPAPVRIDDLVRSAINRAQPCANAKFITINYSGLPAVANVDPDRFLQLFSYLLDNGIKFTPTGGRISISTHAEADGNLAFSVKDTGCGVPANEREKVFDRFYQVEDPMVRCCGGSGVGLYLARTIVQKHGGRLWIDSHSSDGTDLRGQLPAAARTVEQKSTDEKTQQS